MKKRWNFGQGKKNAGASEQDRDGAGALVPSNNNQDVTRGSTADRRQFQLPGKTGVLGLIGSVKPSDSRSPEERRHAYETAARKTTKREGNFALCTDATGSMDPLIKQTKREIENIIEGVKKEGGDGAKIEIFVFRNTNACLPIMERSGLHGNANLLISFLSGLETDGGRGEHGEAVEVPLAAILTEGNFSAVMVATDAAYNIPEYAQGGRTALDLAPSFKERGIPVHTFYVPTRSNPRDFCEPRLKELAAACGGQFGVLDGSEAMRHMATMALLERMRGTIAVQGYAKKYNLLLGTSAGNFARALIEHKPM